MLIGRRSDFFRPRGAFRARVPLRGAARLGAALAAALLLAALAACGPPAKKLTPLAPGAVVLAFGDSLTWGSGSAPLLGADPEKAYPARLEALIGHPVVNAGHPGEVSANGLARLPGLLAKHHPALVVLCHGGNDLLRGYSQEKLRDNLRQMILACREAGAEVVLIGVPRPRVVLATTGLYKDLAEEMDVPLDGEILASILADGSLKHDLVHPNARGYEALARAVAELLAREGAIAPLPGAAGHGA